MKLVIDGKLNPTVLKTKDGSTYYNGSLDLRGTQITVLPDNLTVGGSLYLSGTQITVLPDNLTVGGSLYLSGTQITVLPDNLTVGGYLDLRGTQIINYPVVYNCGNEDRSIYLDLKDKSLIRIGCFIGDEPEAIHAIKQKYSGKKADAYITKVRECFAIWERMQEVSAGQV